MKNIAVVKLANTCSEALKVSGNTDAQIHHSSAAVSFDSGVACFVRKMCWCQTCDVLLCEARQASKIHLEMVV